MSTSIIFTSLTTGGVTALHSGAYTATRLDGVESAPGVEDNVLDIAYQDGSRLISSRSQARTITYEGKLSQSTAADLRTSLDALKRDVSGNGYLDVILEGDAVEKRYRVHVKNFVVPSASYHLTWVPVTIVFMAYDPFAEDKAITGTLFTSSNVTGNLAVTATISGSASANVSLTVRNMPAGNAILELVNLTTGERLQTTNYWPSVAGGATTYSVLSLNSAQNTLLVDGTPTDFIGTIPHFPPGPNSIQINFLPGGSSGIDQQNKAYNRDFVIPQSGSSTIGQMFSVGSGYSLGRIDVLLLKRGTPTSIIWTLYKGAITGPSTPAGLSVVKNGILTPSAISTHADWVPITFTPITVATANNGYYLELSTLGASDIDNAIIWKGTTEDAYAGGQIIQGGAWDAAPGDMTFKVWKSTTVSGLNADVQMTYRQRWQ